MKRHFADPSRWLILKGRSNGKWYVIPPSGGDSRARAPFDTGAEALAAFAGATP